MNENENIILVLKNIKKYIHEKYTQGNDYLGYSLSGSDDIHANHYIDKAINIINNSRKGDLNYDKKN